jgi:hypothetical protein
MRMRHAEAPLPKKKPRNDSVELDLRQVKDILVPAEVREQLNAIMASLPPEAREQIQWQVLYHKWLVDTPHPDSRPLLKDMIEAAANLMALIERFNLVSLAEAFEEADLYFSPPLIERDCDEEEIDLPVYRDRIEHMLADQRDLICWLDVAIQRGDRDRPRKTELPIKFVNKVADIIEGSTGTTIRRSNNKDSPTAMLRKIVDIANPDIGPGTIDEVLKARAKKRHGEINP